MKITIDDLHGATKAIAKKVLEIIAQFHYTAQREREILQILGLPCRTVAMGSGGAGQMQRMKDGTIRIQVGYGSGVWNYATICEIPAQSPD
jgi:hypothetical protein